MSKQIILAMGLEEQTDLRRVLVSLGVPLSSAATKEQLDHLLRAMSNDDVHKVIVTADVLPDGEWTDVLECVQRNDSDAQVIVTSKTGGVGLWCEVIQRGAYDFLPAPYERGEVERLVQSALLHVQSRRFHRELAIRTQAAAA